MPGTFQHHEIHEWCSSNTTHCTQHTCKRAAVQRLYAYQRPCRAPKGLRALPVRAQLHASSDEGFVFGAKGYVAGIPTDPGSQTGHRLRMTLWQRPHEFVGVALSELQTAFGRAPRAGRGSSVERKHSARQQEARSRLLEDIMYFWMLAEAYVQHPALQADMRSALKRSMSPSTDSDGRKQHWLAYQRSSASAALAAGREALRLQSRVQLLNEDYQGQYMIGSVRFVRDTPTNAPSSGMFEPQSMASQGISWGGGHSPAGSMYSQQSLNGILGLDAASFRPFEAETPSSMNRQGAARAYHTYMNWGYFQRRMSVQREAQAVSGGSSEQAEVATDRSCEDAAGSTLPSNTESHRSYAGDACRVWRYFESVPEEMSTIRTQEAVAVADRHLRSLFGQQEECITSLAAWQHMCTEARWVGRALFDAEEVVLLHTQQV